MTSASSLITSDSFMYRCIQLARMGAGYVAPNPMVGAVLVYEGRIIGEGHHQKFGEAHAEVNCLNSVKEKDKGLVSKSTLYVSLEPCNFFGKTPACTELILKNKISRVVIGCRDPNKVVNGKGIEDLKTAGVEVALVSDKMEKECIELNKRYYTFQTLRKPYIILKWAESANNKITGKGSTRLFISNDKTNHFVHKWRSEEFSILVGTNTALMDDPELTNRLWNGPSPIRLVLDMDLRLPETLKIFDQKQKTIIFNCLKQEEKENLLFFKIDKTKNLVHQLVQSLYQLNIQSVLVEGGPRLLQSFIDEKIWDEIRVIKNEQLLIIDGIDSPILPSIILKDKTSIGSDIVNTYIRS